MAARTQEAVEIIWKLLEYCVDVIRWTARDLGETEDEAKAAYDLHRLMKMRLNHILTVHQWTVRIRHFSRHVVNRFTARRVRILLTQLHLEHTRREYS